MTITQQQLAWKYTDEEWQPDDEYIYSQNLIIATARFEIKPKKLRAVGTVPPSSKEEDTQVVVPVTKEVGNKYEMVTEIRLAKNDTVGTATSELQLIYTMPEPYDPITFKIKCVGIATTRNIDLTWTT